MATRQTGFLILSAVTVLAYTGCVKAPFSPPWGGIYTSVKVPLQYEFKDGGTAYANASGSYSTRCFAWPYPIVTSFAWDDCSIQKAAQDGDLSSVSYADYEFFQILGIFRITTVRAYGPRAQQRHVD